MSTHIQNLIASITEKPIGQVAINMKPVSGAWGGSSVFVWQFMEALKRYGFKVRFNLKKAVDVILIVDPREDLQFKAFGIKEIEDYKTRHPEVKIIHRINECDQRKKTVSMDEMLRQANILADWTVFISAWLKDYFVERWFNPERPHSVIYNGANPNHFHPVNCNRYVPGKTMRVVTHHWSDNPMKGFPVYQQLDEMIASGKIRGFEFWVIGRWPKGIQWRSARTVGPTSGRKLGDLLRQCHLYITASLWEPCGMHHVEGAQCGLPLLSHVDGGGIVEAAEKYGLRFKDNLKITLEKARSNYPELKKKVINYMPDGDRMASSYVRVVYQLLAEVGLSEKLRPGA